MSRKGIPTKPNKTEKATAADSVFTKNTTAKWIVDYFKAQGSILEPAAGENAFYNLFENEEKYRCEITDGIDFFEWNKKVDWIITNPPYKYAQEFIEKALQIIPEGNKVAMFLKIQFLEGKRRKKLFLSQPPKTVYVSSSRLLCAKNAEFEKMIAGGGSAVAYGWYVWEKGYKGKTELQWFN